MKLWRKYEIWESYDPCEDEEDVLNELEEGADPGILYDIMQGS